MPPEREQRVVLKLRLHSGKIPRGMAKMTLNLLENLDNENNDRLHWTSHPLQPTRIEGDLMVF